MSLWGLTVDRNSSLELSTVYEPLKKEKIYSIDYFQVAANHNDILTHSSITPTALPTKTKTKETEGMDRWKEEQESVTSLSFNKKSPA